MDNKYKKWSISGIFGNKKPNFRSTRHSSLECPGACDDFKTITESLGGGDEVKQNTRKLSVPILMRKTIKEFKENYFPTNEEKVWANFMDSSQSCQSSKNSNTDNIGKKVKKKDGKKNKKQKQDESVKWECEENPSTSTDFHYGPMVFPATPELILEHHRRDAFLSANEEWVLIELNEYECLVDSLEVVKTAADHSVFYEVDPEQLWEEFFEFVSNSCCYDEIINEDIWQEFQDKKYSC